MLSSLSLKNFQKWENLTVRFSHSVTVLVGPTDSGKSSVLRALYWLCFNRPLGNSFLRSGEDVCRVSAKIDGRRLKRSRDGTSNSYSLDGKSFQALGREVPEEIMTLLNLTPDNFQRQHDPHFWLSLSSGDLAKELNRIVNLDRMDRVNHTLSSWARTHKVSVSVSENRLEQARAKKDSLAWVTQADKELCILEDRYTGILEKTSRIDRIRSLIEEGGKVKETRQNVLRSILDAGNVLSLGEGLTKKQERVNVLNKLIQELRGACRDREKLAKETQKAERELGKVRTCPTCGALTSD